MTLVHEWIYHVDGKPVGKVVRYEENGQKKVIPYFKQDGSAGIPKDMILPLYGKVNESFTIVVEGEKCVDALLQFRAAAVTSQGGAKKAYKSDWEPLNEVKVVFLLPDNDQAGEGYINDVADILYKQNPDRDIRVITLEGMPPKGDIVNWIQARLPDWDGYAKDPRIAPLNVELRKCAKDAKKLLLPKPKLHDFGITNMGAVDSRPVNWLCEGYLPKGTLVLLGGEPGTGKTTIAMRIAATVTMGAKWPFSDTKSEVGRVIILTAEDSLAETLKPRLEAAGADSSMVDVIESVSRLEDEIIQDGWVSLANDLDQLDGLLTEKPDTVLIVIDPLSAYLDARDSHRDTDVRAVLGPLTKLMEKHAVCILGITHLNKDSGKSPMNRFMGSKAFVAAARVALLAVKDREDNRYLFQVKNNLAPEAPGHCYDIELRTLPNGIQASRIAWLGETEKTALGIASETGEHTRSPALTEAKDWLEEQLADGPKREADLQKAAVIEKDSFSWVTVKRAKKQLGIHSHKTRFTGGWKWYTKEQYALMQQQENRASDLLRKNDTPQGQEYDPLGNKNIMQTPLKANDDKGFTEGDQDHQEIGENTVLEEYQSTKGIKSLSLGNSKESKVIL